MKRFKKTLRRLCRATGVEEEIKQEQRLETANHLIKAGEFFANGFPGKNIPVANALMLYAGELKNTNEPDLGSIRFNVTISGEKIAIGGWFNG